MCINGKVGGTAAMKARVEVCCRCAKLRRLFTPLLCCCVWNELGGQRSDFMVFGGGEILYYFFSWEAESNSTIGYCRPLEIRAGDIKLIK